MSALDQYLPDLPIWAAMTIKVVGGLAGGYIFGRTVSVSYTWTFGEKKEGDKNDL